MNEEIDTPEKEKLSKNRSHSSHISVREVCEQNREGEDKTWTWGPPFFSPKNIK